MKVPLLENEHNDNCITKIKNRIRHYYGIIPSILAVIIIILACMYFIYLNNYFNQLHIDYEPTNITFNEYYNSVYWTTTKKADCYLIYYLKNVPSKIKGTITSHHTYTSYLAYIDVIVYKQTYVYHVLCVADNINLDSDYYSVKLYP